MVSIFSEKLTYLTAAFLGVCFKEHRIHINAETTGLSKGHSMYVTAPPDVQKDSLKIPDHGSFNARTLFWALAIISGIFNIHKDSKLKSFPS
jgi:hypothetical protein